LVKKGEEMFIYLNEFNFCSKTTRWQYEYITHMQKKLADDTRWRHQTSKAGACRYLPCINLHFPARTFDSLGRRVRYYLRIPRSRTRNLCMIPLHQKTEMKAKKEGLKKSKCDLDASARQDAKTFSTIDGLVFCVLSLSIMLITAVRCHCGPAILTLARIGSLGPGRFPHSHCSWAPLQPSDSDFGQNWKPRRQIFEWSQGTF
jgi:hypothetical protein